MGVRKLTFVAPALGFVLAAACGGGSSSGDPDGGGGGPDATPGQPDAAGGAPDPLVLAGQVDEGRMLGDILALQDLGTRYTFSPGDEAAADLLVAELEGLGLAVERDPFAVDSTTNAENIIARHPGVEDPSIVYIFSAHYDSISNNPTTAAPGADDNATGVAAVLEAARLLTPHSFRHSLWFVFTAAEEQGSLGSAHMVGWLAAQGIDVRGVIAPDMIGYWPRGDGDMFDILGDDASQPLVTQMSGWAVQLDVLHDTWNRHDFCYGDDHTNFQEAGFPAITPMDCVEAHNVPASGESTPHYHLTTDRVETLYMPFTARVVGVIVATFADLGGPVAQ